MRFFKRTRGFSLIELLITMGTAVVLFSLSWPSWEHFFVQTESRALLRQLCAAMQFARQEAMLRQAMVTLCAKSDEKGGQTDWRNGLLVFLDHKENGRLVDQAQLLQVFRWSMQGTLHWRAFPQHQAVCQFLPSGATSHENGTFWYCLAAVPQWALVLSQSGRFRLIYPDQQGKLNDGKGVPLRCGAS